MRSGLLVEADPENRLRLYSTIKPGGEVRVGGPDIKHVIYSVGTERVGEKCLKCKCDVMFALRVVNSNVVLRLGGDQFPS